MIENQQDSALERIEKKLDTILEILRFEQKDNNLTVTKTDKKVTLVVDTTKDSKIQEIFDYFHDKINKRSRLIRKAEQKILARLKEYSLEELKMAMDNFSNDVWWMKNNAHRGVAWFFHSEDRIEQFINLIPQKATIKYELFHNGQACKYFDGSLKIYAPWSGSWLSWNKNHPQYEHFILKKDGEIFRNGKEAYDIFLDLYYK